MPSLGISSGITATNKFRRLSSISASEWGSSVDGWTANNANISQNSGQLIVEATSSAGYAQKLINIDAGATYVANVVRHYVSTPDYNTFASFGAFDSITGATLGSVLSISTDATSNLRFSFVAENVARVALRLITVTNGKYTEWDDFSLTEEGVY
jgi:hypothetical protein